MGFIEFPRPLFTVNEEPWRISLKKAKMVSILPQ